MGDVSTRFAGVFRLKAEGPPKIYGPRVLKSILHFLRIAGGERE